MVDRADGGAAVTVVAATVCTAPGCTNPVIQPRTGRPRETCSERCKKARQRQEQKHRLNRWPAGLTVEELAERAGCPVEVMAASLEGWNMVERDDFGRWRLTTAGRSFGYAAAAAAGEA
jgi:hypothetical protein